MALVDADDKTHRLFFDSGECNLTEYIVHAIAANKLFINEN